MKASPAVLITRLLFEVGTLRKLDRLHKQALFTSDSSDNIASHSFRVTMIGLHLALMEGADVLKVILMCLFHDIPEARSGDHNWIHKRYVKVLEDKIIEEQLHDHPFRSYLEPIIREYEGRKTKEAWIAKDADYLDQHLLLREYEMSGNREAARWVKLKQSHPKKRLFSDSAKRLNREILRQRPSDWWQNLWTNVNL